MTPSPIDSQSRSEKKNVSTANTIRNSRNIREFGISARCSLDSLGTLPVLGSRIVIPPCTPRAKPIAPIIINDYIIFPER